MFRIVAHTNRLTVFKTTIRNNNVSLSGILVQLFIEKFTEFTNEYV